MPVPSTISDLSITPSANSPATTESVIYADDYFRSIQAIIKTEYNTQQTANATYALKGANSNITSLSGLTTPLSVAQGGTGATTNAGTAYALKGSNSDITALTGLTTPLSVAQGGTGSATNAGTAYALKGANSDITSLTGLTGETTIKGAALLGYGTGSGGTVTQATSKNTTVTLNKPNGQITMNAAALASATEANFIVNNSLVSALDNIILTGGSLASSYIYRIGNVGAGAFSIFVKNNTAGSLSQAVVINFAVIKGASA